MVDATTALPPLLSSPPFSQSKETGVLFQYKTSSGLVWKSVGSEKLQPKYEGQVENGTPNGQGTVTSSDGSKYVGSWKNGKKNRQGTFTYPNGEKYEGEWKDGGLWNGTGYDKNGNITYKYDDGRIDKTINPLKQNQ